MTDTQTVEQDDQEIVESLQTESIAAARAITDPTDKAFRLTALIRQMPSEGDLWRQMVGEAREAANKIADEGIRAYALDNLHKAAAHRR